MKYVYFDLRDRDASFPHNTCHLPGLFAFYKANTYLNIFS